MYTFKVTLTAITFDGVTVGVIVCILIPNHEAPDTKTLLLMPKTLINFELFYGFFCALLDCMTEKNIFHTHHMNMVSLQYEFFCAMSA